MSEEEQGLDSPLAKEGLSDQAEARRMARQRARARETVSAQRKAKAKRSRRQVRRERDKREKGRAEDQARLESAAKSIAQKAKRRTSPEERELASRVLSQRHLLPFIQRLKPDYEAGWVHRDICRRLEKFLQDVADKKSPRLMLQMPPRHGKSEICSDKFPAWALGKFPKFEIISCSYASDLAMGFSRKVRGHLRDQAYKSVFDQTFLDKDNQNAEGWMTTAGGGFKPAGVGGPITGKGAHCFPAGTLVSTPSGAVAVETLQPQMRVLTIDRATGEVGTSVVRATHSHVDEKGLVEIGTAAGRRVRATRDHRFYVPAVGWIEARDLRPGDPVLVLDDRTPVHTMQNARAEATGGSAESGPERAASGGLLPRMPRGGATLDLSDMRVTEADEPVTQCEVLLPGVHPVAGDAGTQDLPDLRGALPTEVPPDAVLFARLRQRGALHADDGVGELEVQRWDELRALVSLDAPADPGAGSWLRSLRGGGERDAHPPRGPRPDEQPGGESGDDVRVVSHHASQVRVDTVSTVERARDTGERVYDIQVEGTRCFFAGQVLAHNCLIIDDPVKNAEEAASETSRQSIKDWYTSTAYTRLAPGGGVLVIQTRWHDDDLSGWLEHQMEKDEGDQWEIVRYPAIAVKDERYRKKGEALHKARYPLESLLKIRKATGGEQGWTWNALYQQNPVADDGSYFTRQMLQWYTQQPPTDMRYYCAWDLAIGKGDRNDYTVGVCFGVDRDDNLWLVDMVRGRFDSFEIVEAILDMHQRWKPASIGVEKGQIAMAIGPLLQKRIAERRLWEANIRDLPPGRRDKEARARAIQGRMKQGKVYFPKNEPWITDLVHELLRFPNGVHDDAVDAIAWVGLMLQEMVPLPHDREPPLPSNSWKRKLSKFTVGGRRKSAMTA